MKRDELEDYDGVTYADEIINGSCPTNADSDADGVLDSQEIASNTCPWMADSDGDGIPDAIDAQPLIPNNKAIWFGSSTALPPPFWWTNSPNKPGFTYTPKTTHKYFYDIAGNLSTSIVNNVTNVFKYNAQNKLARIEGKGFTNDFLYDSQNRRIGIKTGTAWRYDIHDGNICITSIKNGTIERIFVRGAGIAEGTGDVLAEIDSTGAPYFYVANHRGDTLQVLNSSGVAELDLRFDAFGNQVSSIQHQGSFSPRYTFSTKEFLADAKLYLYAYRVYDPVAGRWTQRDPIDYQDSPNLYQFCGNNPVNLSDKDGQAVNDVQRVQLDQQASQTQSGNSQGQAPGNANNSESSNPGAEWGQGRNGVRRKTVTHKELTRTEKYGIVEIWRGHYE